jgi:hypothetical protein
MCWNFPKTQLKKSDLFAFLKKFSALLHENFAVKNLLIIVVNVLMLYGWVFLATEKRFIMRNSSPTTTK